MSLRPFLDASFAIQLHEVAAIGAFFLGAVVLWRRKGNAAHRVWGKVWVVLMLIVAVTSIFIHTIKLWGNYSPIHLLTVFVLFNLPLAIWLARSGNINAHRQIMQNTYLGGMIIAGGFTFLPGRMNHEILFGEGFEISNMQGGFIGVTVSVLLGLYAINKIYRNRKI